MTVSNSIIGVSILAMPYCFKQVRCQQEMNILKVDKFFFSFQCGVLLAILMLLASSFISRLTCHYLLKSATMARRRTFELLAFHTFGSMGKLIVELGIIGFLMGTCVAFFVIIGDLGPAIIAKILELEQTDTLRTTLLVCVAAFCVLPLGLLRNVESLSSVSTATIGFYFCLVLKVNGKIVIDCELIRFFFYRRFPNRLLILLRAIGCRKWNSGGPLAFCSVCQYLQWRCRAKRMCKHNFLINAIKVIMLSEK